MKRFLFAAAVAAVTAPALASDVGVSINVGQPGFYGQINIGNMPAPQLIYPQPVIIQRAPGVVYQPLYLHVPPGHAKHWGKHCYRYNACGRQVYFVQDNWYNEVYAPRYREHRGDRGERRDERRDDWDDRGEHGRGHGNEHGNGHGKGHGKHHNED